MPPATTSAPIVTLRRVIISVLLAGAVVLFGYGFASGRDPGRPTITDPAVEGTDPKPGDLDLRQARIGIDLASGYTASLKVDGVNIPDDQLEKVVGLDQLYYTPGPGTETGALSPGRHCATATITKLVPPNEVHDYVWCFQLH